MAAVQERLHPRGRFCGCRAVQQIVGPEHDDEHVRALPLHVPEKLDEFIFPFGYHPPVLPIVDDLKTGLLRQQLRPGRVISPAEEAARVIAVCVGISEAPQFHPATSRSNVCVNAPLHRISY